MATFVMGKMRRKGLAIMAAQTADTSAGTSNTGASVDLGPATGLSCRECGTRFELGPIFACVECFGPLEVSYDLPLGDPEALRAAIEQAPTTSGATRRCCPSPRTWPPSRA